MFSARKSCLLRSEPSEATNNYFSTRHGPGVSLSENNTVATAIDIQNAVAYTALPIPVGRLFQLKCIKSGIIVSSMIVCSSQLLIKLYIP